MTGPSKGMPLVAQAALHATPQKARENIIPRLIGGTPLVPIINSPFMIRYTYAPVIAASARGELSLVSIDVGWRITPRWAPFMAWNHGQLYVSSFWILGQIICFVINIGINEEAMSDVRPTEP
jgi:hypothetical protein